MELKVWVEGIQRVICGVGEQTTCREVVTALANATRKTGHFTLVERWRDNERLLSPTESPVQVLHKWGEYAMDVQFILRHSESRTKSKKARRTADYTSHNGHPVKKALTFSGGHSYSIFPPKARVPRIRRPQDNCSLESLEDEHSVTSQSSRSTVSPYASFEGQPKASTPEGFPTRSPYGSFEKKHWAPSSRSASSSSTPRGSFERRVRKTSQSDSLGSSPKSTEYDLNKNIAKSNLSRYKTDATVQNGDAHVGTASPPLSSPALTSKDELLRLVSQQAEKLNEQDLKLEVLESEIVLLEPHVQEQDEVAVTLQAELERVQVSEEEQSGELEELELVSWDDKLTIERRLGQKLQKETQEVQIELEQLETQLQSQEEAYQTIRDRVHSEQEQQEREFKDQEGKVLREISSLQKQIAHSSAQHEEQLSSLETAEVQVKQLESGILDRKKQTADLETNLKEVNLGTFVQAPSGWRPSSASGKAPPFSRSSSARPAARRILSSPLQLKEIVATDKNPHGLWV